MMLLFSVIFQYIRLHINYLNASEASAFPHNVLYTLIQSSYVKYQFLIKNGTNRWFVCG